MKTNLIPLLRRGGSVVLGRHLLGGIWMRKKIIAYDQHLKPLARQLRNQSTLAEILLWQQLKTKKMLGYDFDRQKPIDWFIVDFFCTELRLAIEIDGESHRQNVIGDRERQARLESLGIRFLRFEDRMVKQDMRNILASIQSWILQNGKTKY
jgi:very-short-patch-repair endonuclease